MLPNITNLEVNNLEDQENTIHKTYKWNFEKGDFELKDGKLQETTDAEYIKIWAEKLLRTRIGLEIYDKYGSGHHDLIGRAFDLDFAKSEITRIFKESLLSNEAIRSMNVINVQLIDSTLRVKANINTIYGNLDLEVVE